MLEKVGKKTLFIILLVVITLCVAIIAALAALLAIRLTSKDSNNDVKEDLLDTPAANYLANQLLARINFSADPCDNFYEYSCGHWHLDHPLPSDKSYFDAEELISEEVGNDIVDAFKIIDMKDASNGLKFAKNFFDKCMDIEVIERESGIWLGKFLHSGKAENDKFSGFENGTSKWPVIDSSYTDPSISLEKQIGQLKSRFGIDTFIYSYVLENEQNSSIINIWLTGSFLPLGLGVADFTLEFYLNDEFKYVFDAYSQLQSTVAQLLARDSGFGDVQISQNDLDEMLRVEKQLAQMINETKDEEDAQVFNLSELETHIPEFNWQELFSGLLPVDLLDYIKTHQTISVTEPSFAKKLAEFFKSTPRRALQNYMIWRLIMYNLPFLSSEYKTAYTTFQEVFRGQNLTTKPQKSICLDFVRGNFELPNLGYGAAEALIYTKFNQSMREQAQQITSNVAKALIDAIESQNMMDDETKRKATEKANLLKQLVAYPDWMLNISAMNDYYKDLKFSNNVSFNTLFLELRSWAVNKNFGLIRSVSIDELSFRGSPVLTNAFYQTSENSIVIPVGELHSPAFGFDYPNLVYGSLGSLIGHEVSHGFFDPNGAAYDGNGNEVDWWSNSSKTNFQKFQQCLIDQFNGYCYSDEIGCVDGTNTLSENAADLAGINIAFEVFKKLPKQRLLKAPMFTSDQLFFLSFPLYFCGEQTDASLIGQLIGDSHTPNLYRVNGALRNMPEFSIAFGCSENSYMNPTSRCEF